jgi:hypothetical protein
VLWTSDEKVLGLVSDDKWAKAQAVVQELRSMLEQDPDCLNRKHLEQIWGYLIHVTQAYHGLKPYLNGLHLTI